MIPARSRVYTTCRVAVPICTTEYVMGVTIHSRYGTRVRTRATSILQLYTRTDAAARRAVCVAHAQSIQIHGRVN